MDNYGINMVGEFKVERVTTKPTPYNTSTDVGRIIFVTSENSFYVGGNSAWISASSDLTTHMSDTTTHGITTGSIVGTTDVQTLTNKTIDADNNTISDISDDEIKIGAEIDATKIATGAISNTEFNYLDGVTSNIQTQLDAKEDTIALTASRAMVTNGSGGVAVSSVTSTELGYLDGVTSNIQTQLSGVIPTSTSMLFNQSSAPTGWTKKSDWAANASIVVGNTYGSGGTDSPTSWTTALVSASHVLTEAQMASHTHDAGSFSASTDGAPHTHNIDYYVGTGSVSAVTGFPNSGSLNGTHVGGAKSGGSHTHTITGSTSSSGSNSSHSHTLTQDTYTPIYQVVIAASKD